MPAAKVLSKEVSPWQKDLQGTYLKGERVCTGILCACSQVHVSCLWTRVCDLRCFEVRRVQAEPVLLAARERHRPVGHWISVLPQHRSRWVTGVSSFDDRDWCQTPTELVWGSIMLSSPFLFAVFAPCSLAFYEMRPWKTLRETWKASVWYTVCVVHFSWPDCRALGDGNHISTDLYTDTRLWASLAVPEGQIVSCSCTHTNTQTCLLK